MPLSHPESIRLLALDVDGTLLDGQGELRPRTIRAIHESAARGIRTVLCTGRRFRRARPVAERLGLDAPLVCNSGALVKTACGMKTLWRADFDRDLLEEIERFFEEEGEPAVAFLDRGPSQGDFLVPSLRTGRIHFDQYVELNIQHAQIAERWAHGPHFHVCAVGERPDMVAFEERVTGRLGPGRIRTFVQRSPAYSGTMCEILRGDASKWSAVLHVAEQFGIAPQEICAVGDDMNDLPMIEGSGLGVAMSHAPQVVRDAADLVTHDNDRDGLAAFIEEYLLTD